MGDTVQSCTDYSDNEYEHEVAGYTDDESDYDYDKGQLSPSVTQALEMDIDEIIARSYRNRCVDKAPHSQRPRYRRPTTRSNICSGRFRSNASRSLQRKSRLVEPSPAQLITPPTSQQSHMLSFDEMDVFDPGSLKMPSTWSPDTRSGIQTQHEQIEEERLEQTEVLLDTSTNTVRSTVRQFLLAQYTKATSSILQCIATFVIVCFAVSMTVTITTPVPLANRPPVPDLVKVAGVARSFESLIYYSEGGANRVTELQRTSHAIWDLGETVRYTNIPSASLIYDILDSLSDDLNVLSMEMNKFFARVDSDIDGILIILQWARRELHSVHQLPWNPVAYMLDNFYLTFAGSGIFEQPDGQQTKLGTLTTAIIGRTQSQRARHALERTFLEFLGVMESVVTDELERSLPLLARFDAADSKFQLLAETVQRDDANADDALERRSALATLWTRLLGPRATAVQKYARNKELLRDVRTKTQSNKYILVDHNAKLAALKAVLDGIRKTLVSPLIRTVNSTSLTLADQIKGLDEVSSHLSSLRQDQRKRLLQLLYGTLEPRLTIDDREEEGQVKGAGKS
ncbi:hypothetical protein CFIMG_002421RA [Ceratocystis fimbriata CBS 114723]|uniref:Uncharacterized protein n=1 Tax=Ceratocystis fimbriata CBS 114723 TaxID=1035309 RepID=A0A2C5X3Y8_9PEZI|nr:hypothetical protein CFIMG_002421RA [Ceratocystis fimbriata CBS 114723]